MDDSEVSTAGQRVLRTLVALQDEQLVPTVQAIAIRSGVEFTTTLATINELFTAGLVAPDLTVTDRGRKVAEAATERAA